MLKITSPYSQEVIRELPLSSEKEVHLAIETANQLLSEIQMKLPPYQRIKILENAKELMKIRFMELVQTATLEGGKPISDTRIEVERAINGVQLAIQGISELKGEQIPMGLTPSSQDRLAFTYREPIGVVVAISAFNHPVNLIVHQAFTAIAAGCPVIVKPSLKTPLSCLLLQEILLQSGLEKDWFQVLLIEDELAEQLATSSKISFLSFIGSARVGWHLKSKLAPGVRCALEHGGVAPVLIDENINLDEIVPQLAKGAFYHAGQVCVSVQRIFATKTTASALAGKLAEYANAMNVGDPLNPETEIGPLIDNSQINRIEEWISQAVQGGGQVIAGGKRVGKASYAPTVLFNPPENCLLSTQEVFGPVVAIYSCADLDEAVQLANALDFQFQASVYSKNIDVILNKVKALKAATVMVNDHTAFRVDWMPFGGRRQSGYGVGGIVQTMKDLTQEKLVVIKSEGNTF